MMNGKSHTMEFKVKEKSKALIHTEIKITLSRTLLRL